jgi:hypothetical protein
VALFGCFVFVFLLGAAFAAFGRRHLNTVFAVARNNTMESSQIHSGLWHQGRQFGNEIQRLEDDMGCPIIVPFFVQNACLVAEATSPLDFIICFA